MKEFREIVEIFTDDNVELKVVNHTEGCWKCYYVNRQCNYMLCTASKRKDKKDVIFIELHNTHCPKCGHRFVKKD